MTAIEEHNVFIGEMAHPRDLQDSLREFHDSYVIDLQPHKDAVHDARIQREARQAERRRERMRERAGEQQGQIARTIIDARIDDLKHDIKSETDIDEKMRLLDSLEEARRYEQMERRTGA